MGKETNATVKLLAALLSKKWDREYAAVCGYVRARLSLILERSFSHLLRGDRERKGGGGEPKGTPDADRTRAADGPWAGGLETEETEETGGRQQGSERDRYDRMIGI